jgi:hypothetical protein
MRRLIASYFSLLNVLSWVRGGTERIARTTLSVFSCKVVPALLAVAAAAAAGSYYACKALLAVTFMYTR